MQRKCTYRKRLAKLGITPVMLGQMLGVKRRMAFYYLSGEVIPPGKKAVMFAKILQVPLEGVLLRTAS